jgi:hypothetical protein
MHLTRRCASLLRLTAKDQELGPIRVMSAAMASADGITPIESRPVSIPDVLRSVANLELERRPVIEDGVCPLNHPFAVSGKPEESLPAFDDRHTQLLLELADATRQG